ncbi:putative fatty acyl-CoA reductase, partial [Pseudolycoriella hygida]
YFSYGIVSSKIVFTVINAFVHILPGYLLDAFAYCTGRKLMYRAIYRKISRLITMMSYFGLREWHFENTNIQKMSGNLQAKDKNDLQFNIDNIDWIEYFHYYLPGIKKYLFKENSVDVRRSR